MCSINPFSWQHNQEKRCGHFRDVNNNDITTGSLKRAISQRVTNDLLIIAVFYLFCGDPTLFCVLCILIIYFWHTLETILTQTLLCFALILNFHIKITQAIINVFLMMLSKVFFFSVTLASSIWERDKKLSHWWTRVTSLLSLYVHLTLHGHSRWYIYGHVILEYSTFLLNACMHSTLYNMSHLHIHACTFK